MRGCALAIIVVQLAAFPKLALSFHGSHPAFHGGHASMAETAVETPMKSAASDSEAPDKQAAPAQAAAAPAPSAPAVKDSAIVAMAELKIQRFGHKCKEREQAAATDSAQKASSEAVAVSTAAPLALATAAEKPQSESVSALSSPPILFQIASEDSNTSAAVQHSIGDVRGGEPSASPLRQVGEVALQENSTVSEPTSSGTLAIAADSALPPVLQEKRSVMLEDQSLGVALPAESAALSTPPNAPLLPSVADASVGGEHIHVGARVATQEVHHNVATQEVHQEVHQEVGTPAPTPDAMSRQVGAAAAASPDAPTASVEHIHVSANVATQDATVSSKTNSKVPEEANSTSSLDLGQKNAVDTALNVSLESASNTTWEAVVTDLSPGKVFVQSQSSGGRDEQARVAAAALSPLVVAAPTSPGFLIRHRLALVLLVVVATVALMSGLCLVTGFLASFIWQRQCGSTTRSQVEELPICNGAEVERKLPASGGYDCIFSKPLSSCELLRIEARVEGPQAHCAELVAPLTGQACVLYSVAVSKQLHDGMHPVPVAFASASSDFVISLRDAPQTRINLRGEDVSLFDVGKGRCVQRKSFAAAPEHWQDFILTHRAAAPGNDWQTSSHLRADSTSLEFQECALHVGMLATFVGELHRGADGTLTLRPLQVESRSADIAGGHSRLNGFEVQERWRTSWERDGCEAANVATPRAGADEPKVKFDKVLASDDVQLLGSSASVIGSAAKLLRRLPARAFSLVIPQRSGGGNGKGVASESPLK